MLVQVIKTNFHFKYNYNFFDHKRFIRGGSPLGDIFPWDRILTEMLTERAKIALGAVYKKLSYNEHPVATGRFL